jgi:hypothetical protein
LALPALRRGVESQPDRRLFTTPLEPVAIRSR